MGNFEWLSEELRKAQEKGCPPSAEAQKFMEQYRKQMEAEERSLKERQAKEQHNLSQNNNQQQS